jgi:RNA polymerase sigma-70 factor (ECF subfamily)
VRVGALFRQLPGVITEASAAVVVPSALDRAFAAVYREEFANLWHTLRRLGVRPNDLPDVTHDVFVTAYCRFADYDPARPVRPWLFGIAYRTVGAYFRRVRNTHEVVSRDNEDAAAVLADPAPPADVRLTDAEALEVVQEALLALDVDRRAVLVMHDIDEHPVTEIAAALEIPVKTMYSRLRSARELFAAAVRRARLRRGER